MIVGEHFFSTAFVAAKARHDEKCMSKLVVGTIERQTDPELFARALSYVKDLTTPKYQERTLGKIERHAQAAGLFIRKGELQKITATVNQLAAELGISPERMEEVRDKEHSKLAYMQMEELQCLSIFYQQELCDIPDDKLQNLFFDLSIREKYKPFVVKKEILLSLFAVLKKCPPKKKVMTEIQRVAYTFKKSGMPNEAQQVIDYMDAITIRVFELFVEEQKRLKPNSQITEVHL